MVELLDLLGAQEHNTHRGAEPDGSTIYGKILKLIESAYSAKEFSSADIARDYEDLNTSPISLSTVSTYLSRLADRGMLTREKFGNSWVYRLSRSASSQLAK